VGVFYDLFFLLLYSINKLVNPQIKNKIRYKSLSSTKK
jgi:hypothetical protein